MKAKLELPNRPLKVLISAAESSSDLHGAALVRSLRTATDREIDFFGVGGPRLKAEGLRSIVDQSQLQSMGFLEVLKRMRGIAAAFRSLVEAIEAEKPDLAILIDYPEFHLRLAKRLKPLGIPVVDFIPPKLWVWRRSREKALKKYYDLILSILPFEEAFYRGSGLPVKYVGNPLLQQLPLTLTKDSARKELGLSGDDSVLLLMPGSRPAEFQYHLKPMLEAAKNWVQESRNAWRIIMALPESVTLSEAAARAEIPEDQVLGLGIQVVAGQSPVAMAAADLAVIKSGTSTLEAALMRCPHVVIYDASKSTRWIVKNVVRYKGPVGLSNIILDRTDRSQAAFTELLGEEMTPDRIVSELKRLQEPQRQKDVEAAFDEIRRRLSPGGASPTDCAAKEILQWYGSRSRGVATQPSRISFRILSWLWSTTNWVLRVLSKRLAVLGLAQKHLPARVISVGNLQTGGAGKSPLVAKIAREAISRGKRVCVLTRGYQSRWEKTGGVIAPGDDAVDPLNCGDEAALLQEHVPDVWIGVGANRLRQFDEVRRRSTDMGQGEFDLVILDDGFQNWKVKKDLEVLAVTSRRPGELIFRDYLGAANRADLVVWTKGDDLPKGLRKPSVRARFETGEARGTDPAKRILLVTGVGDPLYAKESAVRAGYEVVEQIVFKDHSRYDRDQIEKILGRAREMGCQVALTGKDWVKWKKFCTKDSNLLILEPELKILEGEAIWEQALWGADSKSEIASSRSS